MPLVKAKKCFDVFAPDRVHSNGGAVIALDELTKVGRVSKNSGKQFEQGQREREGHRVRNHLCRQSQDAQGRRCDVEQAKEGLV